MYVILMFARNWVGEGAPKQLPEHRASARVSPLHGPHRAWGAHRKTKIVDLQTNRLVIHIQPDEGITLRFGAKVPGSIVRLGLVSMVFDYTRDFGRSHSTGYERRTHDCIEPAQLPAQMIQPKKGRVVWLQIHLQPACLPQK
jgi:glucose-6-phosphate 1-dehydrogenase